MEKESRPTFKDNGIPSAVPRHNCPMCDTPMNNKENDADQAQFCEIDWRWEHRSHLRTKMHGRINDSKERSEPIVLLTKKNGKWLSEQVV